MESKFTPGPWYVHDSTSYDYINEKNIGTYDIKTTPQGNYDNSLWLADAKPYGGDSFTDKETAKANAHLIAAAPDMFEVIKAIYEYTQKNNVRVYMQDELEAAYIKATGQPIPL